MKKNIIMYTLSLTMLIASTTPVLAVMKYSDANTIIQNDLKKNVDLVSSASSTVMVSAEDISDILGLELTYSNDKNTVVFSNANDTLEISTDDGFTYYENNTFLVPLETVCNVFSATVAKNTDGTVEITANKDYLNELENALPLDETTVYYTFDEALSKALNNDSSLKDLQKQIDDKQEQLDENQLILNRGYDLVERDYDYVYTQLTTSTYQNYKLSVKQLRDDIVLLKQQKDDLKNSTKINLMNCVYSVLNNGANILQIQKEIETAKSDLQTLEKKYLMGMCSKKDITDKQNVIEDLQFSYQEEILNYKTTVQNINSSLGQDLNQNTYIMYEPTFTEFNMTDSQFNTYKTTALFENNELKKLQNNINYYNYALEINNQGSDVQDEYEDSLNDSEVEYINKKDSFILSINKAYTDLQKDKNAIALAEKEIQTKIDNYNVAYSKYLIGEVSKYELEQKEKEIQKAKLDLYLLKFNNEINKLKFNDPNLI